MGLFGFGKNYTKEDLQREINSLASLFRQATGLDASTKSRAQLKQELTKQLNTVLNICKKGNFAGWETVEWNPGPSKSGNYTTLRNVTPMVEIFLKMI